jgi:glycosyltransferase involved in cell wall biosynthesis
MKLAYLVNIRYPSERANAIQITAMCNAFAANGAEVTLFANRRTKENKVETEQHFGMPLHFALKRFPQGLFIPGIQVTYLFSELFFAIYFWLSGAVEKHDIIYSRQEWVLFFLSFVIRKEKLVWESHEAKLSLPARRLLRKQIKVVVISEGVYNAYEHNGVSRTQMLVAHDGIDEDMLKPTEDKVQARARLGLPQDKRIAMYIGGFDAWKGIETFFAAAPLTSDVLFVAIGGDKEQIESFSKMYPSVIFLGQKPYSELKNSQRAADVLVVPNTAKNQLSAAYTSPLKLFAHMTSGIPLVVSDVPSLTTVTGKEKVTVFVPDDAADLAEKISSILHNYTVAIERAIELRKLSVRYTWTNRAKSILGYALN